MSYAPTRRGPCRKQFSTLEGPSPGQPVMKKSLALLAIATLLVSASGCGCCRGLFGRSSVGTAGPFYGRLAPSALSSGCCQTCAPMCNTCDSCNTCEAAPSCGCEQPACGCESGSAVTYGYNGPMAEMPITDGTVFETTPMTVPTGSGTFGQ